MRRGSTLCALAVALAVLAPPAVCQASDMSGLAVIVIGMFVAVPAALLLAVSIVVSLVIGARTPRRWHAGYAIVSFVLAPALALAFPVAMGGFSGTKFLDLTLVFDLPVVALAVAAVLLARRAGKRWTASQAPAP